MLRELSKYENLGTIGVLTEVLRQISGGGEWTIESVKEYLSHRVIDDRNVFDGCAHLGTAIGAIVIDDVGRLRVPEVVRRCLLSQEETSLMLRRLLCDAIVADEDFELIFSGEHLGFDSVQGRAIIENSAFGFRFAGWRRALLDFAVLELHEEIATRSYWLCYELEQLIEKNTPRMSGRKLLSQEQLYRKLEAQREAGAVAERFVVEFERRRVARHPHLDAIRAISTIDVTAGFDVVSFDSIESRQIDRFIEVKSYSGKVQFYWSRNEREVAKQKQSQYYLYLVDRTKIGSAAYLPTIIGNPTEFFSKARDWVSQSEIVLMTQL